MPVSKLGWSKYLNPDRDYGQTVFLDALESQRIPATLVERYFVKQHNCNAAALTHQYAERCKAEIDMAAVRARYPDMRVPSPVLANAFGLLLDSLRFAWPRQPFDC